MIYVEMAGRCGNQLFHYACARYIQIQLKEEQQMVFNFNSIFEENNPEEGWYDCLSDYNVIPYVYYNKSGTVLKNESSIIQKICILMKSIHIKVHRNKSRQEQAKVASKMQYFLNLLGVFWIREGVNKIYPITQASNNIILTGVCESPEIFDGIASILREELTPKMPVLDKNIELFNKICNTDSICVSVRRGDFFNSKNQKSFAVCNIEYYLNAKKIMDKKSLKRPSYFIFSDDIEWCKKNLKYEGDVTFVSQDMPIYETLRLMYSCKHFIISNSTFSWWGQFLSRNVLNKIVISPSIWNNDGYQSPLINKKDWILLDTE